MDRFDKLGRKLNDNEYQRKDGRYVYYYQTNGKTKSITSRYLCDDDCNLINSNAISLRSKEIMLSSGEYNIYKSSYDNFIDWMNHNQIYVPITFNDKEHVSFIKNLNCRALFFVILVLCKVSYYYGGCDKGFVFLNSIELIKLSGLNIDYNEYSDCVKYLIDIGYVKVDINFNLIVGIEIDDNDIWKDIRLTPKFVSHYMTKNLGKKRSAPKIIIKKCAKCGCEFKANSRDRKNNNICFACDYNEKIK